MNVFELYASLGLDTDEYYTELAKARDAAEDVFNGISVPEIPTPEIPAPDTEEYDNGLVNTEHESEAFVEQINGIFQKLGIVAALAAAGKAVADFGAATAAAIQETAAYGDTIDKASQKIGISAEAYQEWDAVMQHSGASIGTLQASMRVLSQQAEKGGEAFKKLGISEQEVADLSKEDLFSRVIEGLQGMEEGTERTVLAQQLLGRGAMEYGALLNTSAEATQEMRDRVHELNGVMSDEAVKAAAAFQDQLQDMNTALDGLKRNITNEFLPSITTVMSGLTEIFAGNYDEGINQISEGIDTIVQRFNELPSKISEVGKNIISSLGEAIIQNIPDLLSIGADVINFLITSLIENAPMLVDSAFTMVSTLAQGIADNLPALVPSAVDVVFEIADTLLDNIDMLIDAGFSLLKGLADGLIKALPVLIGRAPEIVAKLGATLIELAPKMLASGIALIEQVFSGLLDPKTWTDAVDKLAEQFGSIEIEFTELGHNLWDALISAWEVYYNRDFSKWKQYGADIYNQLNGGISTVSGGHFRSEGIADSINQTAEDIEQSADNLYDTSVESGDKIDKAGSVLTAHANDYGKNAQLAYAAIFEGGYRSMDSSLKHYAEGLDSMLATHKITQDEYDKKLSAYLDNNVDKNSELWWKYYDGIEKRKEQAQAQALKESQKAQKEADKEAKKSADNVKETITVVGSTILNAFSAMSTTIGTSITDKAKTLASVVGVAWSGLGTNIKKVMETHTKEIEASTKTYTTTLQNIWDGYVGQLDLWKKADIDIGEGLTAWQVGDIDNQTASLQRYEDTYKAVLGRMGDEIDDTEKNLLRKISGMSLEDKTSFTDYLARMTNAEFNAYMQSYKKYVEQAGELAVIEGNSISDINEEVAQSLINDVDYEGIGKTGAEQYMTGFYMELAKGFAVDVNKAISKDLRSIFGENVDALTRNPQAITHAIFGDNAAEVTKTTVPVTTTQAQAQPENITVNINGIQFKTVDELSQALIQAITNTTNRRKAGYAV